LRTEQLAAPAAVTAAFGATTRAAVGIIAELNHQIADLEAELATHFEAHPDADIYLSLPGLGVILGARVLGEFGDDPNRYTTAKSRKNYAGTSPLTIASGKKRTVLARHVRNRRLYDATTNGPSAP
jgi:transposase